MKVIKPQGALPFNGEQDAKVRQARELLIEAKALIAQAGNSLIFVADQFPDGDEISIRKTRNLAAATDSIVSDLNKSISNIENRLVGYYRD